MKPKIYDTKIAYDIVEARSILALGRDDFRGLVRKAKLSSDTAKDLMNLYNATLMADIEGNPMACQPDLQTKVNESEGVYEMWLYDAIDPEFGISSQQVVNATNEAYDLGLPIVSYIKSPGGYVDEGRAISTTLARHARRMGNRGTSVIDSIAASAATTIALANPRVEMAPGSQFMIHKAWGGFQGNSDDVEGWKNIVDKTDENIANDYVRKTGLSQDELLDMMAKETWLNVDEAIDMKFADGIHGDVELADKVDAQPVNKRTERTGPIISRREAFAKMIRSI